MLNSHNLDNQDISPNSNPSDATNFPKPNQTIRIHYTANLSDGTQFDSSRDRDQPITFQLDSGTILPGLEAAIKTMSRGQVARVHIPPEAAYGSEGYPPIVAPNAFLYYDVELISFCTVES